MTEDKRRKTGSQQDREGVSSSFSRPPTPYSLFPIPHSFILTPPFDPGLLVAALLALFAILPLLTHPGLPNTADGPVHLMRQVELNQAWKDGILYPRWAPDLAYGYGMPLFHYAPPLLYHVTQLFHLVGTPLDAAMKGTLVLMLLLYSVGSYLFARDLFGPRAGLLAAAVYLYAPYRLREVYVQGNYGQFCGLAFYPLILWSFHGLFTTRRRRFVPLAALSLAGLLLSHNISAMIFAPLFGVYLVFLWVLARWEDRRLVNWETGRRGEQAGDSPNSQSTDVTIPNHPLPKAIAAIGLGLGLSAFFWLPAFGERDLIRLAGITSGFFDFRHNFVGLAELLALPRPLDLSAINPYFPLSLGLAQIVLSGLAILALVLLRASRITRYATPNTQHAARFSGDHTSGGGKDRGRASAIAHALFFAAALLITAFLTLPASRPVWEMVPLLELAEFPWRFLGPALLCGAALAGAFVYLAESWRPRAGHWALGVGLGLTLIANLYYLFPAQFIPWGTPTPAEAVAYEVQSRAIGTTSAGEFLPRWADSYPAPEVLSPDYQAGRLPAKLDPAGLPPGAKASTLLHTARETRVALSSPVPFQGTFRTLYWPGWRVVISQGAAGDQTELGHLQVTRPEGLIRVRLPAGEYQVSLRLFPTPTRRLATIISILSLVALLGLVVGQLVIEGDGRLEDWKIGGLEAQSATGLPAYQLTNLPIFQALAIGAALLAGLLITRPMADWFRVQSPPDVAYGAQFALQTDFGGQVRLLGFGLSSEKVGRGDASQSFSRGDLRANLPILQFSNLPSFHAKAGGRLPVVLYWRALAPLETNYSVFVHLDAPDGQTYASADELNPADIPTSQWPPSLYLRNPLTLELPADLPPVRYTLTAGLYGDESGERLPVTACRGCAPGEEEGDAWPLAFIWLWSPKQIAERDIPHRLDYRLGDRIQLLGYGLTGGGDPALLTLYWRAESAVGQSYTVFIHALDVDGELVAEFDAQPLDGLYPTDAWFPGQIIADSHTLALPETAHTLAVGLYDAASLARLPVSDGAGQRVPGDAIKVPVASDR